MHGQMQRLLQPLNLAALLTLCTVAVSLRGELAGSQPQAWALLGIYTAAFLALDGTARWPWLRAACYLVVAACAALGLVALARTGTAPVTLVIMIAALAMDYAPWRVLVVADAAQPGAVPGAALGRPPRIGDGDGMYLGFQAFAALVAHYARSAEQARDRLARVNADLLATRALLADSARDAERLRVAREAARCRRPQAHRPGPQSARACRHCPASPAAPARRFQQSEPCFQVLPDHIAESDSP